jgi:hypothetical protein
MDKYLKDALIRKTAADEEWYKKDNPFQRMKPEELSRIVMETAQKLNAVGPQAVRFDAPLKDDRNALLKALLKRRYETGWSTTIDGKPASSNQATQRVIGSMFSGKPTGIKTESNVKRGYAPTGLGWGATALGGAGLGGAAGAGIASLLGKDKMTGGLIGAGLGGIATPLALLAYGKAKGGFYGPTQKATI